MHRRRLPEWVKGKVRDPVTVQPLKRLLRSYNLHTVCEEAKCPNIGECFSHGTATFLIMGPICTRNCHFCAIDHGVPRQLDPEEPRRVAEAVKRLDLKHVVITSVTRDDLEDGGAGPFIDVVSKINELAPKIAIEVLIPDLKGLLEPLSNIACSQIEILNHNIETVPRLYPQVRPDADYRRSIGVLEKAKTIRPDLVTKSGLMVGLGETLEEVISVMKDLRSTGCDIFTIGQYLQPRKSNLPVFRYLEPQEFDHLRKEGLAMGFRHVFSGPLVRSSYMAEKFI